MSRQSAPYPTDENPSPAKRKIVTVEDVRRRLISEHREPYFNWIKQIATVSGSSLTALIALQSQYIPLNPNLPACLAAALALLLLSLLSALYAGRAEWSVPLERAIEIGRIRRSFGEAAAAEHIARSQGVLPSKGHRRTVAAAQGFLAAAFLLLCVFATANFDKIGSMRQLPAPASPQARCAV